MKSRHLLLGLLVFILTSCSNAQDHETKFFKITPGMTKEKVLSIVGKPKFIGQEQSADGVVEVWHYPYSEAPKSAGAAGVVSSRLGPTKEQKIAYENELASQRYNSGPRDIVFKDSVVLVIRRSKDL